MLTMTATESGSKELERLLAVIGAQKDQAAFAALYSATKEKAVFHRPADRQALGSRGGNYPGSLRAHLAQRELLSFVTWVTDDLDDHHCPQSGDRHGQKAGARILFRRFKFAGAARRRSHGS